MPSGGGWIGGRAAYGSWAWGCGGGWIGGRAAYGGGGSWGCGGSAAV